jgi:DDE superfamily endonuclease
MNPPRCTVESYIDFLIATPEVFTATEAGRVQPQQPFAPAHDAFTRLLNRLGPDPGPLWEEARPFVRRCAGVLVLDDSVLDKPYARHMGLVGWLYPGKHRRVVRGINLLTLLWTDGDGCWPCDYRLTDPADGRRKAKNDHFRDLLAVAHARGFSPRCVCFDEWYSGRDNLKAVRSYGWTFLTQLRSNRKVNLDRRGNRPISELAISPAGTVVHLEGFGLVKVFRIVAKNGDTEHWVTNDLGMDEATRLRHAEAAWSIEEYHRGLKQHCGAERCQARQARAQRNHIGLSIRAFLRLECHRFTTGVSWFEAKVGIIRDAVRAYLARPLYRLTGTA